MLKIATFNIQNDYKNYSLEKTNIILKYLKDNKIDILNIQELYNKCEKDLLLKLNNYKLYGDYRFKLKILTRINEKVPIITNKEVIDYKTYQLPHYPSLLKRVMTRVLIKDKKYKNYVIINIHLDYQFDKVKEKQLKYLLNYLKQEKYPIILTGDFNLKNNKEVFNNFVAELKKMNINHIETKGKTLKQSNYKRAIDHIFYSNYFKLKDYKIITNLPISDHYPVEAVFE